MSHILLTKGHFFFLFMKATMIEKYFWNQKKLFKQTLTNNIDASATL